MSFFKLKRGRKDNKEWKAMLPIEENKRLNLVRRLSSKDFSEESLIEFRLFNIYEDPDKRKETPFSTDLIYWTDDITFSSFMPNGEYAIISHKFKSLLERLTLPPHKFLNLEVKDTELNQKQNYYLFILEKGLMENIDYQKSSYILKEKGTRKFISDFDDNISSFDQYKAYLDKFYNEGKWLDISKYVLNADYDIAGGVANVLLISENAKKLFEQANLNGIDIVPSAQDIVTKTEFETSK